MKRLALTTLAVMAIVGFVIVVSNPVHAQLPILQRGGLSECTRDGSCTVEQIIDLANNIIQWGVRICGALALFMYVLGGSWMIFSGGNSSRVERGKDIVTGTTLALFFILGSWLIIDFALRALNTKEQYRLSPLTCGSQQSCAAGYDCVNGQCKTLCSIKHPNSTEGWQCQSFTSCGVPSWEACGSGSYTNCEKNLCPGGQNNVCCYARE